MKRALTVAAALISVSLASAASATPSLSYAAPPSDLAGAEFVDIKFKLKKFGGHRGFHRGHRSGFGRGHFGTTRFGHHPRRGYGHGRLQSGAVIRKGHGGRKLFFGKGLFLR